MFNTVFAALTSFFTSLILVPFIIWYSEKKKFLDEPGGRRIHKRVTPSLGGIAIFFGFIVSGLLWTEDTEKKNVALLLGVLGIPFLIGLLDDLLHLKPVMKIIGQTFAATFIFFVLEVKVQSSYGLFGDHEYGSIMSYLFTLGAVVLITNSFNLIDGIDGLGATFSILALLFFGLWFHFAQIHYYSLLSFALSGGILAFLLHNWEPSKIFMGDTGSLVIGVMLSILTIEFLNFNYVHSPRVEIQFRGSLATAFCVLVIPLIDTIRIVIIRLAKRISPLKPDKRHIHHSLVRLGASHRLAVSILCLVHISFIALAIALKEFSDKVLLPLIATIAVILTLILGRLLQRRMVKKKYIIH